jgi:hypothetical protein
MPQVKLIIADRFYDTVYFNYGDDYSDITRILVEDHSPWEEVSDDDIYDLQTFVSDFNNLKKSSGQFAFLINKDKQISAQSAIKKIVKKREDELKKQKEAERLRKEKAEKAKQERQMKKLAKTKADKLKLFEALKKELKVDE